MGAIDRVYRFLCCITLGDAAKNGQNNSSDTGNKSIRSQGHGLGPMSPSSSQLLVWDLSRNENVQNSFPKRERKSGATETGLYILMLKPLKTV